MPRRRSHVLTKCLNRWLLGARLLAIPSKPSGNKRLRTMHAPELAQARCRVSPLWGRQRCVACLAFLANRESFSPSRLFHPPVPCCRRHPLTVGQSARIPPASAAGTSVCDRLTPCSVFAQ